MQKTLNAAQLSEFYIKVFVDDQVRDFKDFFSDAINPINGVIVDVGGGEGYFASAIKSDSSSLVRVVEMDPVALESCKKPGIEAEVGDATNYAPKGDESIVCFNLILHHLVANSEKNQKPPS